MIRIGGRVNGQRQTVETFLQVKSLVQQGGQRTMHKSLDYVSEVMRRDFLSGPYPTEIERRSGSFAATWRRGHPQNIHEVRSQGLSFIGRLGSEDRRARILAVGGTIRPTGGRRFLTIPTGFAKTATGQVKAEYRRPAREIPNTFLIRRGTRLTIWQSTGQRRRRGRLSEVAKPIFFLVPSVTIRGRFYHTKTERKADPGVQALWRELIVTIEKQAQPRLSRGVA